MILQEQYDRIQSLRAGVANAGQLLAEMKALSMVPWDARERRIMALVVALAEYGQRMEGYGSPRWYQGRGGAIGAIQFGAVDDD